RAFAHEALLGGTTEQLSIQELHRRAAFEAPIAPVREPDLTHAAAADALLQGIRADLRASPRNLYVPRHTELRRGEKSSRIERGNLGEERAHLACDLGVRRREIRQPALARGRLELEGPIEIRRDAAPGGGVERQGAHARPQGYPGMASVLPR